MRLRIKVSALQEVLHPGDDIPNWYGISWIEPGGWNAICYPFGLHIAVRWLRLLYEAVQIPRRAWWEKRLMDAGDLAYDRGVVIGKSMGTNIDGINVFSKSQLNRRMAVARDENNQVQREPIDQAFGRGFQEGWAGALDKIGELAGMDPDERLALAAQRASRIDALAAAQVEDIDENEAQARRAESDKYSEVLQEVEDEPADGFEGEYRA